jgi:cytochrome b6-f complex iron-sulfur subunit
MVDDRREEERSERFERYLEALIGGGRPSPEDVADGDEAEMARLAAEISGNAGAIPDPDPAFVEQLRLRMRAADQGIRSVREPPPIRPDVAPAGSRRLRLTRRELMQAGLGAAAGLAAGVAGGYVARDVLGGPDTGWSDANLVAGDGEWTAVATEAQLPAGAVLAFSTPAFDGFVVNDAGEIRAVGGACSHLGCRLTYRPDFNDLRCPCHPASFNLRGWLANGRRGWRQDGPYPGDAEPYPIELPPLSWPRVKVEGGQVYVWTTRA